MVHTLSGVSECYLGYTGVISLKAGESRHGRLFIQLLPLVKWFRVSLSKDEGILILELKSQANPTVVELQ
jgi:hypothetical protein